MIKRRTQAPILTEDDFVNGVTTDQSNETTKPDPKAPRKFKSHTLPLNEYEYNLLVALADKYGQTHSGIIRSALKQVALKSN